MKRFLLIFLLIGISQVCLGQGTCKLHGVVLLYDLDLKKEPLPNVMVELLNDSKITKQDGSFELNRDCNVKVISADLLILVLWIETVMSFLTLHG